MRVNRQIFNEASTLLHSNLTVVLSPGDALTDTSGNSTVSQTRNIWRHAPRIGLGFTNSNGETVYNSYIMTGFMEPYIFARFEKIAYNAYFDFECDDMAPGFHINDNLSARAEDATKFLSYLTTIKSTTRWFEDPLPGRPLNMDRRDTVEDVADIPISSVTATQPSTAGIIQKFADLLLNSPFIRHLEVTLHLYARTGGRFEDPMSSDDETESVANERDIKREEVANERATELFLESGVLNCLRNLSNVKCLSINIATSGRGGEVMKPQKKHMGMIRDLK